MRTAKRPTRPGRRPERPAPPAPPRACEAEVAPGLEEFARAEVLDRFAGAVSLHPAGKRGTIRFGYAGDLQNLLALRTAGSVYVIESFAAPRPLALLGHENFQRLLAAVREALALHPAGAFSTLRISAAGEGSAVYDRLRAALGAETGLVPTLDAGDLLIRVRRPPSGGGFEATVRLSPRPLSARPWRVCDLPGALNGAVARVLVGLTRPDADDSYLNLACGSGTLLVERLDAVPARSALGVDTDPAALECARANLRAAGHNRAVRLEPWDAGELPLPDASVSALCGDLPWGHRTGAHAGNVALYPRLLAEAGRVAADGARLALLTSEARLLERVLGEQVDAWRSERTIRFEMDGVHLRAYVLERRGR